MTEIEIGDTVRFKKDRYGASGWTGMEGVVEGFYDTGWRKLVQVRVTKEADIRPERKLGELVNDKGLSLDDLQLIGKAIKVGDKVKFTANNDYAHYDYRVAGFVDGRSGLHHVRCRIVGSSRVHVHARSEVTVVNGPVDGEKIEFKDIKVGMTIRAESVTNGIKTVREGVVGSKSGLNLYNEDVNRINNDTFADWTYTLVKDVPKESPNLKKLSSLPGHHVVYKQGTHFVQTGVTRNGEWLWVQVKRGSTAAVEVTNADVAKALDEGAQILKPAA